MNQSSRALAAPCRPLSRRIGAGARDGHMGIRTVRCAGCFAGVSDRVDGGKHVKFPTGHTFQPSEAVSSPRSATGVAATSREAGFSPV